MKKRTFFALLAMALLACAASFNTAQAQCCYYTVIIDKSIPEKCLPIVLGTQWDLGRWRSYHDQYGTFTITPNAAPFIPCPPNSVDNLVVATVNDYGDVVFPNECGCNIIPATGCKLRICTSRDKAGCWVFKVTLCD